MRVLCSFPGRAGDLLWSLPSIRAVSEYYGQPVDLLIAGEFNSLIPLLRQQVYLGEVLSDSTWSVAAPESWLPPEASNWSDQYDRIYHLGYRRWPELPLPLEIARNLSEVWWRPDGRDEPGEDAAPKPDLGRPWITVARSPHHALAIGWTDCWFELKFGLMGLLSLDPDYSTANGWIVLAAASSRWETEGFHIPTTWLAAAKYLLSADLFLGDCSALHVLACAVGTLCLIVEPMEARWNPIFYPYGMDGPQVTVVKGNDGRPSFDARHTKDALLKLQERTR